MINTDNRIYRNTELSISVNNVRLLGVCTDREVERTPSIKLRIVVFTEIQKYGRCDSVQASADLPAIIV
jgi:hypothetical protein